MPCVKVLGSQLRILSATPDDSGEYICRVQGNPGNHGGTGSPVRQASVSVSVTSSSSRKLNKVTTAAAGRWTHSSPDQIFHSSDIT